MAKAVRYALSVTESSDSVRLPALHRVRVRAEHEPKRALNWSENGAVPCARTVPIPA